MAGLQVSSSNAEPRNTISIGFSDMGHGLSHTYKIPSTPQVQEKSLRMIPIADHVEGIVARENMRKNVDPALQGVQAPIDSASRGDKVERLLLRVLARPPKVDEYHAIKPLHDKIPLDLVQRFGDSTTANSNGTLACLPAEIQQMILGGMDLQPLHHFSSTSRESRAVVRSLPNVHFVTENAAVLLEVLFRQSVAAQFSMQDVYRALHEASCSHCGGHGSLLFLPTMARCCVTCKEWEYPFLTTSVSRGAKLLGLPESLISRRVPVVKTLPLFPGKPRCKMVSVEHLRQVLQLIDPSSEKLQALDHAYRFGIPGLTRPPLLAGLSKCSHTCQYDYAFALAPIAESDTGRAENKTKCYHCVIRMATVPITQRSSSWSIFVVVAMPLLPGREVWRARRLGTV